MIPEDEIISVCWEVLSTVLNKPGKIGRIRHCPGSGIGHEAAESAVSDLIYLILCAADDLVVPFGAASGIDDDVKLVRMFGIDHFHQIGGGHSVFGLQIRSAHIDHDGNGVLTVSNDLCSFRAGALRDARVQFANV